MSVADVVTAAHQVDVKLAGLVGAYLGDHGVPQTIESLWEMAREIYPQVRVFRDRLYEQRLKELGREAHAVGVEIKPERQDVYPMEAVYKVIADAVGLSPVKSLNTALVEVLDPDTQEVVRRRISPVSGDPNDAQLVEVVSKRVTASLGRHARAGARNLVANTAQYGYARDKVTKKPVRMGYARVLTGKENCAFCAMLASRGPVYSEDTAVRKRDGRAYHDHCDCVAVLVFQGQPWEGEEQYKRLEAEWNKAQEHSDSGRQTWKYFAKQLRKLGVLKRIGTASDDESDDRKDERAKYVDGEQARRWQTLDDIPKIPEGQQERLEIYRLVNPRYGEKPTVLIDGMHENPWNVNCVRCVNAAELRRRGYNVTAGMGAFKAPEGVWNAQHSLNLGWVDPETKQPPVLVTAPGATRKSDRDTVNYFKQTVPEGAHGFLTNSWYTVNEQRERQGLPRYEDPKNDERTGHILVWEKKGGEIVLHDPQNGRTSISPQRYFKDVYPGSVTMVRIDNVDIADGVLDVLGGDEDLWR